MRGRGTAQPPPMLSSERVAMEPTPPPLLCAPDRGRGPPCEQQMACQSGFGDTPGATDGADERADSGQTRGPGTLLGKQAHMCGANDYTAA